MALYSNDHVPAAMTPKLATRRIIAPCATPEALFITVPYVLWNTEYATVILWAQHHFQTPVADPKLVCCEARRAA